MFDVDKVVRDAIQTTMKYVYRDDDYVAEKVSKT